jgi:tetratricopeptide (TPR) repeat protein
MEYRMKIFFILLVLFFTEIYSIDKEKFNQIISLISEGELEAAKNEIDELKKTSSDDAEYYVLIFNYYFQKAHNSYISLQTEEPKDSLYIEIRDTSNQNVVGYLAENVEYDLTIINEGLEQFKPALQIFPNRLDLFFGLVHLAHKCKLYSDLKNGLLKILDLSKSNNNLWLWSFNEKLDEDPKDFMLNNIQAYLNKLFQEENLSSDSIIVSVSDKMIEIYPKIIYGYNNLGAINYFNKNYSVSMEYFLEAEKINPQDILVLANLAQLSKLQNDIQNAETYYYKIITFGNEEEKSWAEEQIKILQQ